MTTDPGKPDKNLDEELVLRTAVRLRSRVPSSSTGISSKAAAERSTW